VKTPDLNQSQKAIVKKYVSLAKKNKMHPGRVIMMRAGVTRDQIRHHFGSLIELKRIAKAAFPSEFEGVIDEEIFNPKRHAKLQKEIGKKNRFFITTVVTGCKVHPGFLKNIDAYCKANNAAPLFLLASDPAATGNGWVLDPVLKDRNIVFQDVALNSNIFISTIKLSAKHIDPITSMGRIGQREGSFVYASPKQRLKYIANSNVKMPHAIMTTGACTIPDYQTTRYMSDRTAYIANHDHVVGGIIVEVVDNKIYHFRQVQAEKTGSFIDLGNYYQNGKSSKVKAKAFVLGDYHAGETDPMAEKAWLEVIKEVGAETVVFHDLFNGNSISHHEIKNKLLRAQRAQNNQANLEDEIKKAKDVLNLWADKADSLVVTKSNHDEFLDRYLDDGRFMEDPQNLSLALELAQQVIKGKDPLKYAVEKFGLKKPAQVKWLKRDEDFKIARIELGAHGDKGSNGSKGSLKAMENAYGNSVSGHSHTPEIIRGAWQVGTTSLLKLAYNKGPSSWMHSSCLVYANGSRQLINAINGNWRKK
jgi:hypothetical protein